MNESEFSRLRQSDRRWIIEVIAGPNMKHLGRRDRRLFGDIASFAALREKIESFAAALGVEARVFVSDYEGEILERVHHSAATADAYIIDPGGLATVSQGWPHALLETHKPVVEVTFYNPVANGEISVFTRTAIGRVMGLREHSYTAALLSLVLSLDDRTFLNPDGPESVTRRKDGTPYSFKLG